MKPEDVARLFHETYERLAPEHGYQTRKASAVPWEDVPDNNKSLMIAVAAEVGAEIERQAYAKLFGSPEEIRAREAEATERAPDDTVRLCEMARPGEHERRVRAKVAAEIEVLRDGVRNPDKPYNEAFVHALDCAIREIARGERR